MSRKNKRMDADIKRVRRVQEIRRSSAASPKPAGTEYRRKPKHKEW